MLLRDCPVVPNAALLVRTPSTRLTQSLTHLCAMNQAQELTQAKTLVCSFFFFSCLDSFFLGQVPSLLLYTQLHNAGCSLQKRWEEWTAGESSCSATLSAYSCFRRSQEHRLRKHTLGQFCQSNIPQLNPSQHEISESDTCLEWILHDITVTLIWSALIAEKQPSTWAFLTAEPLWLASLDTGNRNLTSKPREKLLPQKHYAIISWILLLAMRVRKKFKNQKR